MQIFPVISKNDLKDFIQFPYDHYKNDTLWVPPLRVDVKGQFNPKKNHFLAHCEYQLFLLKERQKIIGRIAAFIDHIALDFWKEAIGLFGYFECIEDPAAAEVLLNTAKEWCKKKNCTKIRGPWSFVSQEWGSVVEGFAPPPTIMGPYNPSYYNDYYSDFGLEKVKDLLCWSISAAEGYQIPERIVTITDKIAERYQVSIRRIDLKNYDSEVEKIMELSNQSIINNWGYSPVTDAEAESVAEELKPVAQSKAVLFAVDKNGQEIGFAIALPNINVILKDLNGRLFPFGIIKLLRGLPHINQYRMFALGVIPEYHGKAIDSLLYRALHESLFSPDFWMEINYVLEDNWPMVNAIKKLGATPLRRYRVYQMDIG